MMQSMKRITKLNLFFTLMLTVAGNFLFAENINTIENQKITVSKIRVFLDEEELLPEADSNQQTGTFSLSTVLSFTQFKAGKKYSPSKLEKELKQTKLRLLNSGLFYNASVEQIESRKNPGTYIIYINVRTGFLKRYGGGGIYALFGNAGMHKNREQLLWFAGWNQNGLSYLYEHAFNSPLILGGNLFTDAPYGFTNDIGVNINGTATVGSFITPDIRICVDADVTFNFKQMFFSDDLAISPYLSITEFASEKLFTTTEVRVFYYPLKNWENMFDTAYTINYSPVKQLTFAVLAAGGYCPCDTPSGLSLNRDNAKLFENIGLANRGIRSGYSDADLTVRGYLMGTLEVRWNAFNFTIPPCFPGSIIPYVFADVAAAEKLNDIKGDISMMDAYGLGIQLRFDCPVFATFNFSYGFNHEGKGKFCFAAVQSF